MYCVTRWYGSMSNTAEAAKRAEKGLAPILQRNPDFRGYYVVDAGGGVGMSITVFESKEAAERSQGEVMRWIEQNVADLYREPPQITAGEIVTRVEAPPGRGREAETGAEARPH